MITIDSLRITPELLSIIAELDEFKGAWRALGTLAPERLTALRRVATIESIGSSTRIAGSRLSDTDVQRLSVVKGFGSAGTIMRQSDMAHRLQAMLLDVDGSTGAAGHKLPWSQ